MARALSRRAFAAATARDTLVWYKSQRERTKLAGPTAEAEAELLKAWKTH